METTTVKISYSQFFDYKSSLDTLSKESSSLSWTVTRCLIYAKPILLSYQETLKGLVELYALKDEKGKLVLVNSNLPALFDNIKLKDDKGYKVYEDLNKEEIDVKIYKPTPEIITEYLKSNPATINYIGLDKVLFDLEKIEI